MGCGAILSRKHILGRSAREDGWSLVEMTVTLFLLMAIALFGMKTMVSGFMLQNWSIAQSMTDAYAARETAYAQRYVFTDIENGGNAGVPVWGVYPAAITSATPETIGGMPSLSTPPTAARPVTATVVRTYHKYGPDVVTGAVSYLLESYVLYQDGPAVFINGAFQPRTYCKVSKVYRSE
jgi:hypothetical protein